ncbi:MAG: hypothetical protein ACRCZF_23340 [Gemmataceae bacterium]
MTRFARMPLLWGLIVASLLLLPSLGLAGASAAGSPGGEHEPKSIFDLPDRYDLSIYTIFVFLLLLGLLSKFAWPQIKTGMKAREDLIASTRDEALKAKADAEALQKKLAAEYAQANDKIRLMLEEARRDADDLRAKERETGVREAATERDRAKREIEAAKDAALQEIYQQSVQLASLMSSKALRRNMSTEDHSRLVDESLAELKSTKRN